MEGDAGSASVVARLLDAALCAVHLDETFGLLLDAGDGPLLTSHNCMASEWPWSLECADAGGLGIHGASTETTPLSLVIRKGTAASPSDTVERSRERLARRGRRGDWAWMEHSCMYWFQY